MQSLLRRSVFNGSNEGSSTFLWLARFRSVKNAWENYCFLTYPTHSEAMLALISWGLAALAASSNLCW